MEFDHSLEAVKQMSRLMDPNPPFEETYKALFDSSPGTEFMGSIVDDEVIEKWELPLIDLQRLSMGDGREKEECKMEIAKASMEWGFFRVVNHGISPKILKGMREEQARVFKEPFSKKQNDAFMNMSPGSYRWGTPTATCLRQLSWSEAFHIPLDDISAPGWGGICSSPSSPARTFATKVSDLAQELASILAENLGHESTFFKENCLPSASYLRMNRYPPCPKYSQLFGLMPHTDSDFLTILYEDGVGGLQLVKDGRWIAVEPNPEALIINIGDLFQSIAKQAWSNGVYKSVEHRVAVNRTTERFSTAYFFCPMDDAVIQSCGEPAVYKEFSFKEYRQQVQDDVKSLGYKIGLARFVVCTGTSQVVKNMSFGGLVA